MAEDRRRAVSRWSVAKWTLFVVYAIVGMLVSYAKTHGVESLVFLMHRGAGAWRRKLRKNIDATGGPEPHKSFVHNRHTQLVEGCISKLDSASHGFHRVGGCGHVKEHMQAVAVTALKRPDLFFSAELPQLAPARRFLFCGPPGTGKTMVAKAIAADGDALFMNVTLSTVEDKYFGETPKILNAVFAVARHRARTERPVVLMFDELDGMMRARRDDDQAASYGLKTEMLRLLDTLEGTDRVVLVGCTNHERVLDPAVRRRFGMVIRFAAPDRSEREDIVRRVVVRNESGLEDRTVMALSNRTEGMTGSGIANLYDEACCARVRRLVSSGLITDRSDVASVLASLPPLSEADFGETLPPCGPSDDRGPVCERSQTEQREEQEVEEDVPPPPPH
jgi:SpoVK/Ycf46/Vps4 family AAA+-type ATPase